MQSVIFNWLHHARNLAANDYPSRFLSYKATQPCQAATDGGQPLINGILQDLPPGLWMEPDSTETHGWMAEEFDIFTLVC